MLRLGALRARAGADPREFAFQETLAAAFGLLRDALTNGLRLQIRGVIPRMRKRATIRNLDDARGNDIEEVTVMRDEDDGAGKVAQAILQPANGFGVEMVRGLVEQQQVGLRGQCAAERDAAFLAAGKCRDQRVHRSHAQRVSLGLDARLEIPAVGVFDMVEDFAEFRLGAVAGLVFAQPPDQVRRARFDVRPHAAVALEFKLLRQVADAQFAPAKDFARVRIHLARENLQQRAFSAAIAPDESDLFPRRNRKGYAFKQALIAEGQRQFVRRK